MAILKPDDVVALDPVRPRRRRAVPFAPL